VVERKFSPAVAISTVFGILEGSTIYDGTIFVKL
jgi:hypothetical protein